ncbi:Hypothetical predicted protein, partial [Mytilus galloprovincialis]
MAEWEAILVLPFYLCGIAEQWFEMIDSTTKASLANIKLSFLNRFKQHKQEDIGLTYLRQQENEPVDQYLHRALNYNKTNSVSEQFLVKLAYRGLKPQIQQIVVPQNPVSMSDLLSKSITAEMTVNMVQPQQSSVENSILKAVSSIEDKIMDKISSRLDSIAAISSNSNKQQSDYVPYHQRNNHANSYQNSQSFQVPTYNDRQPMMPVQRQRPVMSNGPPGSCIGCDSDKCTTYVTIGTTRTKALIDTGANISVINRNLLDRTSYAKVPLQPGAMKQVIAANGNHVQVLGKLSITLHVSVSKQDEDSTVLLEPLDAPPQFLQNVVVAKCLVKIHNGKAHLRLLNPTATDIKLRPHKVIAKVSHVNTEEIHSIDDKQSADTPSFSPTTKSKSDDMTFDLSSACLTSIEKQKLLAFLQKNRSIFANSLKELGCTHLYNHHIETVPGAKPFRSPPYRQTPKVRAEQDRQVKELLDNDIIEPSCSNWASPVVMCFKKSGEMMRMAIDYRKVNALSIPQTFPLPHMESVFDAIGEVKAQYFSCVDLKSGFHQVPLTEESKHKSAFITQTGIYQFKRMPFGLMNSPITFQAMMSHVLRGLNWKFVLVYVDDILIFSQTFEDHLNHLSQVFDRLRHANLKLHPSKCHFAVKEIMFLGHIISREGVKVDPAKTSAVSKFPTPQTQKQLRSFLGMANYYRRFIKDHSKIVFPLNSLLHKDQPVKLKWTPKCQTAFDTIKHALVNAPVLSYPDLDKPFILTCDASDTAIAFVLGQLNSDNKEYAIAYGNKSLTKEERNYTTSEKECLAILKGVETFRPYLANSAFTVITDHNALVWLKSAKHTGRLSRWALKLQDLNFDIIHRPGKSNVVADCLSRVPNPFRATQIDTGSIPIQEQ